MSYFVGPVRTTPDEDGRARLREHGSFGARYVYLVALGEHANMLIAHKITPSTISKIIDDGSGRAKFRASLRLAAFRFGQLLFAAVARCWFIHAKNIASFWTNFRRSAFVQCYKRNKTIRYQPTSGSAAVWRGFIAA